MSGRGEPFVEEIIQLHREGNYRGIISQILEVYNSSCQDKSKIYLLGTLHLISWPTPTEKDLECLASVIYSLRVSHIHSIGCGTGLLEWLLTKFLLKHYLESDTEYDKKIEVTGIECDFKWWTSAVAPPTFLPLLFVGKDFAPENPFGDFEDMAMFCYCNSISMFRHYVSAFQGAYILIIGPICGCPCDLISEKENFDEDLTTKSVDLPENFKLPKADWKLILLKRFGLVKTDHVAVYKRIDESLEVPKHNKRNGHKTLI